MRTRGALAADLDSDTGTALDARNVVGSRGSAARDGQILRAPRLDPAPQVHRLGEPLLRELAGRGAAVRTGVAVHDHRLLLVLLQCFTRSRDLLERHVARAGKMPGCEGLGGTK